jgi:hypothetical protein
MESARVSLVAMQLLLLIMRHHMAERTFCAECQTSAHVVEWNKTDVDKTTSSTTAVTCRRR